MTTKELCISLVKADKESDVVSILQEAGYWNDGSYWRDYGDKENNFADIGNQQALPESALVEKLINSVDAVLMRECLRRGIDPQGNTAPNSMGDAVAKFFGVPGGKLTHLDPKARTALAANIGLIATGTVGAPCYAIADLGEGQHPHNFPDTFLSLGKSNKLRIHFVQGKFNMGGTGVLLFCGTRNLQLVVSRRDPAIEGDSRKCLWGFTVVRKQPPPDNARHSVFRYLAPNGSVLSFSADSLDILPGKFPQAHAEPMAHGTYIKLYEYNLTGLKTNLTLDPYNRLSALLPNIALPIRLYERRKHYEAHSAETTLNGLSVRLEEDKRQNTEDGFPCGGEILVDGERIDLRIIAFKKDAGRSYVRDEGIVFVVNGQTQGNLPRSFFRRESVGLGYIADSVLVLADCSGTKPGTREDLFMSSRDRLRRGDFRASIEKKLEFFLREHKGLRELKDRRRREEIENRLSDAKPLADLLKNIFERSPTLSRLFLKGERLANPMRPEPSGIQEKFLGKRFPTFFHLTTSYPVSRPKVAHLNQRFQVQYKTDAANDYTQRDDEPGEFSLQCADHNITSRVLNFWNGTATLTVELPDDAKVGQVLEYVSTLNDITRVDPISEKFFVQVAEPNPVITRPPGERRPPDAEKEGKEGRRLGRLAMPNIIEIRKADWPSRSFDAKTSMRVEGSQQDGFDFFVNVDNIHLQTEIKALRAGGQPRLLEAKYKYGLVLLGLGLLEAPELERDDENSSHSRRDLIHWCADAFSPLILPTIEQLGELEIE